MPRCIAFIPDTFRAFRVFRSGLSRFAGSARLNLLVGLDVARDGSNGVQPYAAGGIEGVAAELLQGIGVGALAHGERQGV